MTAPVTVWAAVGIRKPDRPKYLSEDQLQIFFRRIEQAFTLPFGALFMRHDVTGEHLKMWNDTNLNDIRRACIIRFVDETEMDISGIAYYLGLTRTMPHRLYPVAKKLVEKRDASFMAVYETVKQIPFE